MKLIKNVDIFDGKNDVLKRKHHIVIENNLVKEITQGDICENSFEEVIDGTGYTAMPGMVDAHVHLGFMFTNPSIDYDIAFSTFAAHEMLLNGFTTVRDAGGIVQGLKKIFDQGILPGPRIFPSNSCLTQTCGHGDMVDHSLREIQYKVPTFSVLTDGVDEVIRGAREQFYKGASQIKIMAGGGCSSKHDPLMTVQFTYNEMKAAVDVAKDYGTYVMAHLYSPEAMFRAGKAGVKSFEHAHLMNEEAAKMIASEGIFVSPMPDFSKPLLPGFEPSPKTIPVRENTPVMAELIDKYKIKFLFGTDFMIMATESRPTESDDLRYYKKKFGTFKTLLSATGNCYDLFKLSTYQNPYSEGKIGVLEEGSFADILLIDGNPLDDIEILSDRNNIKLIMKDAKIYKNTI